MIFHSDVNVAAAGAAAASAASVEATAKTVVKTGAAAEAAAGPAAASNNFHFVFDIICMKHAFHIGSCHFYP